MIRNIAPIYNRTYFAMVLALVFHFQAPAAVETRQVTLTKGDHEAVFSAPSAPKGEITRKVELTTEENSRAEGEIPGNSGMGSSDWGHGANGANKIIDINNCDSSNNELTISYHGSPAGDPGYNFVITIDGTITNCGEGVEGEGGADSRFTLLITDEDTIHIRPNPANVKVSTEEEDHWIKLNAVKFAHGDPDNTTDSVSVDWSPTSGVSFSSDEGQTVMIDSAVESYQGTSIWAKSSGVEKYIVKANSLEEGGGEIEGTLNVIGVDFEARAGKIRYGFEPKETVQTGDPNAWASVDKDGTSDVVKMTITPASAADQIELVVVSGSGSADIDPKTFTDGSTDLTVTGQGAAGNAVVEARIESTGQVVSKLNIMALPKQTLKVGIYYIKDSESADTFPVGGPSANAVIDTLNDVFKQARIEFELEEIATVDKPYDTNKDGMLQADEIDAVNVQGSEYKGNLKIFFFKNSGMTYDPPHNNYYIRGSALYFAKGGVVFTANSGGSASLVGAHELGHVLEVRDHDTPPWPDGEESLMREGSPQSDGTMPNPGRWLRHEHWKILNDEAGEL